MRVSEMIGKLTEAKKLYGDKVVTVINERMEEVDTLRVGFVNPTHYHSIVIETDNYDGDTSANPEECFITWL